MIMFSLAWKNIWRNKRRSIIIIFATTIGLSCGLFSVGLMTGMYDSLIDYAINREYAHIQIHTKDFKRDELFNQSINDINNIIKKISSISNIQNYSFHTIIEGLASSSTNSLGVKIIGINPLQERNVTGISKSIVEGNYLDKKNTVIIGKKLAEKLKLKINSKIVLSFTGADGNIIYAAFRISGLFNTEATNFDISNVFVNNEDISNLLNTTSPIHEILIKINNTDEIDKTKNEIQKILPDNLLVESWKELAPDLKITAESTDLINTIFLGLILFALLFGLVNTLLMSVLDRIKDFGVLLAIGLSRSRLFLMIILESVSLSFIGGFFGIIIGYIVTQYFNSRGINLHSFSEGLSSYGIPSVLYPNIRIATYFILTIMIIFTSIIAALYPALKAIRLKPVDAIRTIA